MSYPANRFTNWVLNATNAVIGTGTGQSAGAELALFSVSMQPGQVLQGSTAIGSVCFDALAAPSAFVAVPVTNVIGMEADGTLVGGSSAGQARVVVIGAEPLLEAWLATNSQRMVTLYGNPGASYAMGYKTSLSETNWQLDWQVPMTNLAQGFGADQTAPQIYYRAWEFFADPPLLQLWASGNNNASLLLYGRAGTNYIIQTSTNLSQANGWQPMTSFAPTNSFRFIDTGSLTNGMEFYRAMRP